MRGLLANYPVAVGLAVCLHAVLAVLLARSPSVSQESTFIEPKAIKASLVQYKKPEPKVVAKKPPKKVEPTKQITKPSITKKQKPKVEKNKPAEKKVPPPPVKDTSTLDDTLDELLADDANQIQDEEDASEIQRYSLAIENQVYRRWSRPPSARKDMKVLLVIRVLPSGDIVSATVKKGSGSDAFDRSAVSAVKRVERFEFVREMEPRLFETYFREFEMRFSPQDLRL